MSLLITPNRMLVTDANGQPRFDTDNRHIHIVGSVTTPALTSGAMKIHQILLTLWMQYAQTTERYFAKATHTGASAEFFVSRAANVAVFPYVRISGGPSDTAGEFLFSPGSTLLDVYHTRYGYAGAYVVSPIISTRRQGGGLAVRCHAKLSLAVSGLTGVTSSLDVFGLYNGNGQRIPGSELSFIHSHRLLRDPPHTFSYNPGVSVEYKILIGAY